MNLIVFVIVSFTYENLVCLSVVDWLVEQKVE